jgi:hypothetical protein
MGAMTFEIDSSHVPMISQPGFVLDVIREAPTAVQNAEDSSDGSNGYRMRRSNFATH